MPSRSGSALRPARYMRESLQEVLSKEIRDSLVLPTKGTMDSEYINKYVVPSGVSEIDMVLFRGHGGFVRGCRYAVYGKPGSCKSALAYRIMGNAQRKFPELGVVLVDSERAYRHEMMASWIGTLGLDADGLVVAEPRNLDHAYRIMREVAASGQVSVIVWDSYAATMPWPSDPILLRKLESKPYGQRHKVAEGPRINREGVPDIADLCKENKVLWIVINQAISSMDLYGPSIIMPGGNPLEHGMDVVLRLEKRRYIQEGGRIVGRELRASVEKSRIFQDGAKTGREDGCCPDVKFYFDGREVDYTESTVIAALEVGVVKHKGGGYYEWRDVYVQGRSAFVETIKPRQHELWIDVQRAAADLPDVDEDDEIEAIDFSS